MNLELLDPFAKTVPDHVDSVLSYGVEDATVCRFDKRGTYLAVGYATGVVVIWDFVTRGIGRVIEAHVRGITALSWARGGRRLLSASHDHRLHLWALESTRPDLLRVICMDSPVMSALMLPGTYGRALALTADGAAHMVDIKSNTKTPLLTTKEAFSSTSSLSSVLNLSPAKKAKPSNQASPAPAEGSSGGRHSASLPAVLCLAVDRRGSNACLGTSNGRVISVNTSSGKVSRSISVTGCSKVKQLDFSRDGKWMLVNGGERVIRMLERDSATGKSVRDFQDVVNRTRWQCCLFTGDSEYIAGGSRADATCSIYIWTVEGHLVTRLEGPQMGLRSLARHPVRPFLGAALTTGKVQLWGTTHTANWTAFAADFEELEENVVYMEKEDEFDVVVDSQDPEGQKRKAVREQQEEEAIVSIDTIDTVGAWSSDSEGEESGKLFYLSTEPGAAAREGWYDLDVQTSKRGHSAPENAERGEAEWTSVRTPAFTSDGAEGEGEREGFRSESAGGVRKVSGGGKSTGGSSKRKSSSGSGKSSKGQSSQRGELHKVKAGSQAKRLGSKMLQGAGENDDNARGHGVSSTAMKPDSPRSSKE